MKVNVNGLINRLDDLRERMYNLFNKLEKLDDLEQEEIEVEYIEKCFQDDDTFNLSLATVMLEQTIKLDNVLEIIKNKQIDVQDIIDTTDDYDLYVAYCKGKGYTEEYICSLDEFILLKEVL